MSRYHVYVILGFVVLLAGCVSSQKYLDEGKALQAMGDAHGALASFSYAIKNNPNSAEAYYRRGNVYLDLKKDEAAINDYTTALRINPFLINAYFNRGLAYEARGDYKKSLQDFLKVVELQPDDADAHKNIGIIYDTYVVGGQTKALVHYKRYLELGGTDEDIKQRVKER